MRNTIEETLRVSRIPRTTRKAKIEIASPAPEPNSPATSKRNRERTQWSWKKLFRDNLSNINIEKHHAYKQALIRAGFSRANKKEINKIIQALKENGWWNIIDNQSCKELNNKCATYYYKRGEFTYPVRVCLVNNRKKDVDYACEIIIAINNIQENTPQEQIEKIYADIQALDEQVKARAWQRCVLPVGLEIFRLHHRIRGKLVQIGCTLPRVQSNLGVAFGYKNKLQQRMLTRQDPTAAETEAVIFCPQEVIPVVQTSSQERRGIPGLGICLEPPMPTPLLANDVGLTSNGFRAAELGEAGAARSLPAPIPLSIFSRSNPECRQQQLPPVPSSLLSQSESRSLSALDLAVENSTTLAGSPYLSPPATPPPQTSPSSSEEEVAPVSENRLVSPPVSPLYEVGDEMDMGYLSWLSDFGDDDDATVVVTDEQRQRERSDGLTITDDASSASEAGTLGIEEPIQALVRQPRLHRLPQSIGILNSMSNNNPIVSGYGVLSMQLHKIRMKNQLSFLDIVRAIRFFIPRERMSAYNLRLLATRFYRHFYTQNYTQFSNERITEIIEEGEQPLAPTTLQHDARDRMQDSMWDYESSRRWPRAIAAAAEKPDELEQDRLVAIEEAANVPLPPSPILSDAEQMEEQPLPAIPVSRVNHPRRRRVATNRIRSTKIARKIRKQERSENPNANQIPAPTPTLNDRPSPNPQPTLSFSPQPQPTPPLSPRPTTPTSNPASATPQITSSTSTPSNPKSPTPPSTPAPSSTPKPQSDEPEKEVHGKDDKDLTPELKQSHKEVTKNWTPWAIGFGMLLLGAVIFSLLRRKKKEQKSHNS